MESNEGRVLSSLELPPLASEPTVAKIGLAGGACALVAGLMGLVDISAAANETLIPARVILSALGMLIAGSALTLRYRWAPAWLIAAGTCLCAGFGFPSSWDSFRLVAYVFGAASV